MRRGRTFGRARPNYRSREGREVYCQLCLTLLDRRNAHVGQRKWTAVGNHVARWSYLYARGDRDLGGGDRPDSVDAETQQAGDSATSPGSTRSAIARYCNRLIDQASQAYRGLLFPVFPPREELPSRQELANRMAASADGVVDI